jgi:hypothetical protein
LCDLIVDPYLLDVQPAVVRGIEGIPQGDLDQWEFAPDDPAWDALPSTIPTTHRRTVVSCYSWPGVRPEPCMHVYGSQLAPLLETLVLSGDMDGITAQGSFHARALWRGSLRAWPAGPGDDAPDGQVPSGLVPGAPAVDSGEADMTAQPGRASVTEAGQLHAGRH